MKYTFVFVLVLGLTSLFGQVTLEQLDLRYGDYTVGFKHTVLVDSSRTYQILGDWSNEEVPRPMSLSMWYPSESPSSSKMKVIDYMRILKEEEEWEHLPDEFILNWFYYPNTPANQAHMDEGVQASYDVDIAEGRFPVIVYSPSHHASSIENFALCEFLASHGYIVLSSPSRGGNQRRLDGISLRAAQTQARDIQFLIAQTPSIPGADTERIVSMGFSFGGLTNVLAHAQNKMIKAIVSLDGAIKYQYNTILKSSYFDVKTFDIPFVQFTQKDIPMEVMLADGIDTSLNNSFQFFDDLEMSEAYHYKFNDLTHGYFSTLGVLFQTRDERQDKSDDEIAVSYKWLCEYTLQFLEGYTRDELSSIKWLARAPQENGVAEGMITNEGFKRSVTKTPTFQTFNDKAAHSNYEDIRELYEQTVAEFPDFEVPEGALNNLGLHLMFDPDRSAQGIRILEFAVTLYPGSSNLYDSLGEGYLFAEDLDRALVSFRRSLELDASNYNARMRIEQLSN